LAVCRIAPASCWSATAEIRLAKKQTVYVPVYSNVFSAPRKRPLQLEATLAVRSPDPSAALRITAIDYYNTAGKLVRRYLDRPRILGPLASTYIQIEEKEMTAEASAPISSSVGRLIESSTHRSSSAS